jgi:hypothetical protein
MTTRAALRLRLNKIRAAIEPRGSRIRITDPIGAIDPGPQTTYVNAYGKTVHTSESSARIRDEAIAKDMAEEAARRAAAAAAGKSLEEVVAEMQANAGAPWWRQPR